MFEEKLLKAAFTKSRSSQVVRVSKGLFLAPVIIKDLLANQGCHNS